VIEIGKGEPHRIKAGDDPESLFKLKFGRAHVRQAIGGPVCSPVL
jgi:hypothetical protein